jgi:replicative DNA helicase
MQNQVLQLLRKIAHGSDFDRPTGGFQTLQQVRENSFGTFENLSYRNGRITGLATGFVNFDRMTGGLQKGELTVIAAPPSMGSTSFATSFVLNAAIQRNAIIGIFSLEMNKLSLLQRMLSAHAGVHISRLVTGFLSREDLDKLESTMEVLNSTRISIDDTPGLSLGELRSRSRLLRKDQHGLDLIVVDSLQLMSSTEPSASHSFYENPFSELSSISQGLSALAKELDVPVVAVLRLPVMNKARGDNWRPVLHDLRPFGSIERDADLVIFIHREAYYCAHEDISEVDSRKAEAIVAKCHDGPNRTFYLDFTPAFARFSDL